MPQLRKPDLIDPLPPNLRRRMQKLRDLVCGGPWGADDDICLIYWKPSSNGGQWVAWQDAPAPKTDPLPEAGVSVP
jgi:hypothetical protein